MKKKLLLLFLAASFIVSIIPFAGMLFNPTNETIGNERETHFPSVKTEDGKFNQEFLSGIGEYFSKHFAFRPQFIEVDATIQSKIFKTSNLPSVITGNNDWLYYSSTLDDYTGRNALSDAQVEGIVNNLRIIQDYSNLKGARFLFTIAPNKSTLYPDNMPYYYVKASDTYNRDTVSKALTESDLAYYNLFDLFKDQSETLYFARDSHWNNKGALLAYDAIADSLGKKHDDYQTVTASRKKDFVGDLSKMIYPTGSEAEYNYYYGAQDKYTYITDTKSVEDSLIKTSCDLASGNLYMYRDSFGNALLPFFASTYENAVFTKAFPMILDRDFEAYNPDTFIMEIAERNIIWFIQRPPVMLSPQVSIYKTDKELNEKINATLKVSEYSPNYVEVRGKLNDKYLNADSVFVSIKDINGETITRECYTVFEDSSRSYLAYFDINEINISSNADISVIIKNGDERITLGTDSIKIGG